MVLFTLALYGGFLFIVLAPVKPVGGYLARVFAGEKTFLDPALRRDERGICSNLMVGTHVSLLLRKRTRLRLPGTRL